LAAALLAAPRSVWDGVYTAEQARRGLTAYREGCLKCHAENLLGTEGGPPISGAEFLGTWNGRTAADLFDTLQNTMPADDPGSLGTRQTADLLAYIFSINKFPPGAQELAREPAPLKEIQIKRTKE
jgi:mono/diheme cytochrome c family protein